MNNKTKQNKTKKLLPVDDHFVKETLHLSLSNALIKLYPSMKQYQVDKCVSRYMEVMMSEIFCQLYVYNKDAMEMNFSLDSVRLAGKQIKVNGSLQWVVSLMQSHTTTKLLHIMHLGNSFEHTLTKAILNPLYKNLIMDELQNLSVELNTPHLKEIQEQIKFIQSNPNSVLIEPGMGVVSVPIDIDALLSYITQTNRTLISSKNSNAYDEKLQRNLTLANKLASMVIERGDNKFYLDELWTTSDANRLYGKGLSLQRMPQQVRHAVLGTCHKYDFKACSFATMTSLALAIDPTIKHAALTEYITKRSMIRKHIANELSVSEQTIKDVFTSMGFGATTKDNPYNSIRKQLSAEQFDKLTNNIHFKMIKEQLENIKQVILNEFSSDEFEFMDVQYNMMKDDKKRTKNQKLAWIYQVMESNALNIFLENCTEDIILTTHDCIYTKTPLSLNLQQVIHFKIQELFPLLAFEHEAIFPIHATEDKDKTKRHLDNIILQHKLNIAEQERLAELYTPTFSAINNGSDSKKQVMTPFGLIDVALWGPTQTTSEKYFKDDYFGGGYE